MRNKPLSCLSTQGRTPGTSTFTSIIYNAFGRTWGTPLQYHVVFVPFGVGRKYTATKQINRKIHQLPEFELNA